MVQHKLVNKLLSRFLFNSNYYCYLNYHSTKSNVRKFSTQTYFGGSTYLNRINLNASYGFSNKISTSKYYYNLNNENHKQCKRSLFTTTATANSTIKNDDDDMNSKYKTILFDKPCDHIAHIQLNKPKSKNSFCLEMGKEFSNVIDEIESNSKLRVIILSGFGSDFTSGIDLKSSFELYGQLQDFNDVARRAKLLKKFINSYQEPFKRLINLTKPIICVQHGLCLGLGIELGACCDIRICSNDVKFSIREILIGIAADVGSLQLMPKLISNQSLLRELIYTGRFLTLTEIEKLNFVSEICETKELALKKAFELAKKISKKSPLAVQGSKQNLRFSFDKSFEVGLDYNAIWNMSMMQGEDVSKAIGAILSKEDNDEVKYDDF